jgi:hypothetical protein
LAHDILNSQLTELIEPYSGGIWSPETKCFQQENKQLDVACATYLANFHPHMDDEGPNQGQNNTKKVKPIVVGRAE